MKSYITIVLFFSMLCSVSAMTTADFYLSLNEKIERKKPVAVKKVAPKKKAVAKKKVKVVPKKKTAKQTTKKSSPKKSTKRVTTSPDYRVNLNLWNNKTKQIIAKGRRSLIVNTKTQRAQLYAGKSLVMSFPVSTGKRGKSTPKGTFSISEKVIDKRSNRYGTRDKRGRFIGAKMPYWMRFNGAIGIHQGKVYQYPASNGCVRVPAVVASVLYRNMGRGSIVRVI